MIGKTIPVDTPDIRRIKVTAQSVMTAVIEEAQQCTTVNTASFIATVVGEMVRLTASGLRAADPALAARFEAYIREMANGEADRIMAGFNAQGGRPQ